MFRSPPKNERGNTAAQTILKPIPMTGLLSFMPSQQNHACAASLAASAPSYNAARSFHAASVLQSLLYPSLVALWLYLLVPTTPRDPDIWWHLRNAAITLETHTWLHRDLYSFTASGAPWIDHEWLAELPFYAAWRIAGPTGLYLVTLLTLEIIFLGVFYLSTAAPASAQDEPVHPSTITASFATILATFLATVSFGPRTLLFGWACLIFELLILKGFAENENVLYVLPLLFLLWVNLHGSWLIGLVLFLTFILCGCVSLRAGSIVNPGWTPAQRRKLALVVALCIAALFVNPYGWRLVVYPFDLAFHQQLNIANVQEWQPLSLQSARGIALLATVAVLFTMQLVRRRDWTLTELAFGAIGIFAACLHARFLFLAGVLVAPILTRSLGSCFLLKNAHRTVQPRPLLVCAMLCAIAAVAITAKSRAVPDLRDDTFPTAAIPYLKSFPFKGHLFNDCLWGGYLIYRMPDVPVFIDSRMDIYERNGVLRDYLDIIHLKNSLSLLDHYDIRYVFFEKNTPLVYLLQQTHAWQTDYDAHNVILLERITPVAAILR